MSHRMTRVPHAAGAACALSLTALALAPSAAQAGSMRCGGDIISDRQRGGQTQAGILYKCGEPYSRAGNTWLYVQPDGLVYRLRFDDKQELTTINVESVRR